MSSPGATPAVELANATVRFTSERGSVTALENVGLSVKPGGFVSSKSGTSCPVHWPACSSHHTYALASLHGRPSGSADARL